MALGVGIMAHSCIYCGGLCYCDMEDAEVATNSDDCVGCSRCREVIWQGGDPTLDDEEEWEE